MNTLSFPLGMARYGLPVMGSAGQIPCTTGDYWYVHHTGSDTAGGKWGKCKEQPFKTWDYAVGQCTDSQGDVIVLMPGHAETISSAGAITLDKIGVTSVGLGHGLLRPTITYDTTADTIINVTAAENKVANIVHSANVVDITMAYDIDATDFEINGCSFLETAGSMNYLSLIGTDDTNNAADGLSVIGCERISVDGEALAFVSILGNCNRMKLIGNFDNQASAANVGHFLIMSSKVCLGAQIIGNILNLTGDNSAQTVGIFATGSSTTSTGVMAYNLVGSLDTTTELFVTAALDFQQFENYYTGTIAKSGKLWPVVDEA